MSGIGEAATATAGLELKLVRLGIGKFVILPLLELALGLLTENEGKCERLGIAEDEVDKEEEDVTGERGWPDAIPS